MAVSAERREQAREDIRQWIEEHGVNRGDGLKLAERYPDVATSTFLRWYQQAVLDAKAGKKQVARRQVAEAKKAAKDGRRRKKTPHNSTSKTAANTASTVLPEPVSPETINPLAARSAIDQVRECIQHADTVVQYCTLDDGRIRNPNLYLKASAHMRASVETLAKVAERLNDAQRIEQIHKVIFEEIRKADPATAKRILDRLQHLQVMWGLR